MLCMINTNKFWYAYTTNGGWGACDGRYAW